MLFKIKYFVTTILTKNPVKFYETQFPANTEIVKRI